MLRRQFLVCGAVSAAVVTPAFAKNKAARAVSGTEPGSYAAFLAGVRREAISKGLSASVVDEALALTAEPNQKVLKADRHQPEFTLTWAQYKARVITDKKISDGQAAVSEREALLGKVSQIYGVDRGVIAGIWGLESAYGTRMGTFHVVDALATLAYDGRRASFFRAELFKALTILGEGDITPSGMLGSYAGAMGQPQFMPSAYEQYAASFPAGGAAISGTMKGMFSPLLPTIWPNATGLPGSRGVRPLICQTHWSRGRSAGALCGLCPTGPRRECGRRAGVTLRIWI